MTETVVADPAALRELVEHYQVCWESYPIWNHTAKGNVQTGFELDLFGTHDHPKTLPMPGCDECDTVYRALTVIAQAILPPDEGPSRSVIEPYDVSIGFSPRRHMREDVRLAIDIVHREHFDHPVDESEVSCLSEMKQKLKDLGVRAGSW